LACCTSCSRELYSFKEQQLLKLKQGASIIASIIALIIAEVADVPCCRGAEAYQW
jgi:uncharacterized paraquat-inducible protein A